MLKRTTYILLALLFSVSTIVVPVRRGSAAVDSCSISTTPSNVAPNSSQEVTLTVENTSPVDGNDIEWIQILRPSDAVSIQDADAGPSWDQTFLQSDEARFAWGSISPGDSHEITIEFNTGDSPEDILHWNVYVSDEPEGGGNKRCNNEGASLEIATDPFNISGISVSQLTSTSAKVSWTSSKAASGTINYGTTTSYGSTATSAEESLSTNHNFTLTGLTPNTVYHYKVSSRTESGLNAASGDNTFTTAGVPVATPPSQPPIITDDSDKVAPTITVNKISREPVKRSPTFSGKATDNVAVSEIQYSIDGGINWLPVDNTNGINTKTATYSFKPLQLEDGNYDIVVKVIDQAGNEAFTDAQTLIIDLLPPIVGGNIAMVGAQIINPDSGGFIRTMQKSSITIVLSAVGGATEINLVLVDEKERETQNFTMVRSADNGLWTGTVSPEKRGIYKLVAKAVDGAGNKTNREVNQLNTIGAGVVRDGAGRVITDAKVEVSYREPETNSWVTWDGLGYGQNNPITVNAGSYGFYLPSGTYHLKASAKGYQSVHTQIFTLTEPTIIAPNITINKLPGFTVAGAEVRIPWFSITGLPINTEGESTSAAENKLIGADLPQFSLVGSDDITRKTSDFYGQPTVMSFVNTWAAPAQEQLSIVKDLDLGSVNIVPVFSGESASRVKSYLNIAKYDILTYSDSPNEVAEKLNISGLPVHYFIDRTGVLKRVVSGVLTPEEIAEYVEL